MISGAAQTIDARNEILPGIVVVPTHLGTSGVSLREQFIQPGESSVICPRVTTSTLTGSATTKGWNKLS